MAQQASDAYAQGMQLFQQGRYPEALDAFNRAYLLSPTDDPHIDDMLQQTRAILTPTATPAPPTLTPTVVPTSIVQSSATPAADLAGAYFGQVVLSVVPGGGGTAVPMTRFSVDDQLGIYIEKLDERLHLGFTLRVFDADTGSLVSAVSGDAIQRFPGKFVWYHQGYEPVGHFRTELYAGDVLTNVFDYVVGTQPVPIPSPVAAAQATSQLPNQATVVGVGTPAAANASAAAPAPANAAAPVAQPAPTLAPAVPPITAPPPAPVPAPPATPVPAPTEMPAPPPIVLEATPTPEPPPVAPQAVNVTVAAGPSALAVPAGSDQIYVADRSGLIWNLQHGQPSLQQPFHVDGEPIGLAADPSSNRLYVAVRSDKHSVQTLDLSTGALLSTLALPSNPGDLALDSSQQTLYVVLPEQKALATVDLRAQTVVRIRPGLPNVSGMALDGSRRTLFVSELEGTIVAIDLQTGAISSSAHVTDVGLSGIALGDGLIYAINTPGQQLLAVDWSNPDPNRNSDMTAESVPLDLQPAALVVGPNSGTLFVLSTDGTAVERVSSAGEDLGATPLTDVGQTTSLDPNLLWQRPRMAINPLDESVYVIQPDAALLAIAAP